MTTCDGLRKSYRLLRVAMQLTIVFLGDRIHNTHLIGVIAGN